DFVYEAGIKVRGNVKYSPLKFLGVLTDFWGVRLGVKARGGTTNTANIDFSGTYLTYFPRLRIGDFFDFTHTLF
ncbi:MAG: hypothetical protein GY938_12460, partial [Ketobacter sp.]|nr:hypothetical protein [Ketobacter sp.]